MYAASAASIGLDSLVVGPASGGPGVPRISKCGNDVSRRACRRARRTAPWPDRTAGAGPSRPRRPACRIARPSRPTGGRRRGTRRAWASRVEPVQLEAAVAGVNGDVAAPVEVEVVEVERGDDLGVVDGLSVWPDHAALDGLAWPQHGVDFVRRVAGLDLVGDDVVGVVALAAGLAVEIIRPPIASRT